MTNSRIIATLFAGSLALAAAATAPAHAGDFYLIIDGVDGDVTELPPPPAPVPQLAAPRNPPSADGNACRPTCYLKYQLSGPTPHSGGKPLKLRLKK